MKKILIAASLVIVILFSLVVLAGMRRYGGAVGMGRRVQAQLASFQRRDVHVPTPLPLSTAVETLYIPTQTPILETPPSSPIEVATPSLQPTIITPVVSPVTVQPTIFVTPTAVYEPAATAVALSGIRHDWQTWNNCAPATLAMNLSYYGEALDQHQIGDVLRPNKEDKHVSAPELVRFAMGRGYQALVRYNGTADRLRLLLSNGIPVMIASWEEPAPNDGMGHYRLITGYDDAADEWILYDSLSHTVSDPSAPYYGIRMSYEELDYLWSVYNRLHLVIYPDSHAPVVEAILGEEWDDQVAAARGLESARHVLLEESSNPFAWFNLGTALVQVKEYDEAASAYDQARQLGLPWRMLWYQFGPFDAYYHVGRYAEVVALADATPKTTQHVEELYYWKALALAAQGQTNEAASLLERALSLRPDYPEARLALEQLP